MNIKVKEIYFEDNNPAPTYVLENGDIKYPWFVTVRGDSVTKWLTYDEYLIEKEKLSK